MRVGYRLVADETRRGYCLAVVLLESVLLVVLAFVGSFELGPQRALDRVGCNSLAVALREFDDYQPIAAAELGLTEPGPTDKFVSRAFGNSDLGARLFVVVGVFETALDAEQELGLFSEASFESAGVSSVPTDGGPGFVALEGVTFETRLQSLETSDGRYIVAAIVALEDGQAGSEEARAILVEAIQAQVERIPDRCLSDSDPVVTAPDNGSTLTARQLGRWTGTALMVGGSIWLVVTAARRARRSDPGDGWAP